MDVQYWFDNSNVVFYVLYTKSDAENPQAYVDSSLSRVIQYVIES